MTDFVILTDTRQQKEKHILKKFDEQNIIHIRTGLPSADYMALRYNNGFVLDYSVLIDTKKDLVEVANNLCNASNHERIKREIETARELGCKDFIFLVGDSKIKKSEDIAKWHSPYTKVKGITLLKIMLTFQKKYGVRFIFCQRKDVGNKIIELLRKSDK